MPRDMLLRSAWEETSLSAPGGRGSIDAWAEETGETREDPIPLEKFLRYADWFQKRFVPDLDEAEIAHVERAGDAFRLRTEDRREVEARQVVIAVGVTPFAYAPPPFDRDLGPRVRLAVDRVSFDRYAGRRVIVVGGGQSGLESAVLAAEAGADVELVLRSALHWFADREPHHPRSPLRHRLYRIAYPAVGYGPPLLNRLPLAPDLLARLPAALRNRVTRRTMRPGGSPWIREVAEREVRTTEGVRVASAEARDSIVSLRLSDGSTREADEVIVAAGFRFSLDRLDFLAPELRHQIQLEDGWPALDRDFRSSVRGLFFVGYAAEGRFGPLCRFVLGTEFTAQRIAPAIAGTSEPTTVLLACDDHYGCLAGLRALRAAGYETWLATDRSPTYSTRSRAAAGIVHLETQNGFVESIEAAVEHTGAKVVLPASEVALIELAEGKDRFPDDVVVGVPGPEIVLRATDKIELAKLVRRVGIPMPPTQQIGRVDANGRQLEIPFPAVVKPVRTKTPTDQGFEHGRVYRVEDVAALREALAELPGERWLLQPFLRGQLVAVAGVAWEGELICAIHQATVRMAPADVGNSAYVVTIPRNAELESQIARLVEAIGWSGLFHAQFIASDSGQYLIDFNPRVYGSLSLSVAAGQNLPAIWVDLLLGREPDRPDYRVGVPFRAEEKDVRAIVREFVKGRRSSAIAALVPRRGTVHAVFSLRDPLPVLTSLAKVRNLSGRGPTRSR